MVLKMQFEIFLDVGDLGRVPAVVDGVAAEYNGTIRASVHRVEIHLPCFSVPIDVNEILTKSARIDLEEMLERKFEAAKAQGLGA